MPLSTGKKLREAQALRRAAAEWSKALLAAPGDEDDSLFAKADTNLRRAAVQYADALQAPRETEAGDV
jgi:hypothetical protein